MARTDYIEITPAVGLPGREVYKCTTCGYSAQRRHVVENLYRCPRCNEYFRMRARERLDLIVDQDSFAPYATSVKGEDPLAFPGYADKLAKTRKKCGQDEAVVCGFARVKGQSCGIAVMDSAFMMGSMGSAVGERLSEMIDRATEQKLPVVIFTCSGGARMQEGLISLMQMAKVSCAIERHREAGLFYLSVITDPTTGGVTASFATEGDVIISEPKALIGFAGRRVIESTVHEELPEDFQTAEFALEHGLIDGIVAREDLREVIAQLIVLHHKPSKGEEIFLKGAFAKADARTGRRSEDFVRASRERHERKGVRSPFKAPLIDFGGIFKKGSERIDGLAEDLAESLEGRTNEYRAAQAPRPASPATDALINVRADLSRREGKDLSAWDHVQLARRTDRPTAHAYLEGLVACFLQMHGDRCYGDDPAIVGGLGFIEGRPVTIITQEKGYDTKGRIMHNFGCAHPEGYRKALRLARQAERFGRPVVCFVDTQGAHCDAGAEERGQGNVIAECLTTFASLRVPVVSVVLSEGGSGGALALAVADRIAMLENAVYSILTPEGFASILWKDASRAAEAAAAMKPTAADAKALGIIDDVIPEPQGGAHEDVDAAVEAVADYVRRALDELADVPIDELIAKRQERFSHIGC